MPSNQFITVREAALLLGVTEKKILDLISSGKLPAYRIAGQFIRLKRNEVLDLRQREEIPNENVQFEYTTGERIRDFFYFNDFYIISFLIILVLLYAVFTM